MKKTTVLATAALLTIGVAAPSFAGERGGSGKWTPIGLGLVSAAICAFAGLEDQHHPPAEPGDVVPGVTQTPHSENGVTFPAGVASICQFLNNGKNPKPPPPPPE